MMGKNDLEINSYIIIIMIHQIRPKYIFMTWDQGLGQGAASMNKLWGDSLDIIWTKGFPPFESGHSYNVLKLINQIETTCACWTSKQTSPPPTWPHSMPTAMLIRPHWGAGLWFHGILDLLWGWSVFTKPRHGYNFAEMGKAWPVLHVYMHIKPRAWE
jgi:hypothetical protein